MLGTEKEVSVYDRFNNLAKQPGTVLIAGSRVIPETKEDRRKKWNKVLGVDMCAGVGVDLVADLELPHQIGPFVHIECTSVLEHCKRPWQLAKNLEMWLENDGTILVAVPFIWRLHNYPSDYWRFTESGVRELFPAIRWYSFLYCHNKVVPTDGKVPACKIAGHPYFARTEIVGFGRKSNG